MTISKQKFEKAQAICTAYHAQVNKTSIKSYNCCVCENELITPIYPENISTNAQEDGLWNNGIVGIIHCGWGSAHDMDKYYIAICDTCIRGLAEADIITKIATR